MMTATQWCFDDFRLDAAHACLWRRTEVVPLTPKAFDMLCYLVTHPDRLSLGAARRYALAFGTHLRLLHRGF